ncbi:ATP-binding protein [Enterobacter ludwigii]|uniref:ATP-binding protein n=1 Tax=Enterobacter ludwigii TaxID=299767 RepID=UPI00192D09E6|nr:ATP-binding protein [Enterobacter ludwigii]
MKSISLPPYAPTLIESTRAIGYTLEAAVADIIDNSISAMASCVDIFFFPTGNSYIAILDDGCGMNAQGLDNAMRYGSQNPNAKRTENDLGRFGLGLKTASLSVSNPHCGHKATRKYRSKVLGYRPCNLSSRLVSFDSRVR